MPGTRSRPDSVTSTFQIGASALTRSITARAPANASPRTVVTTLGGDGGRWDGEAGSGTWEPQALPGPRVDAYGAGDSFAAGLTTGLAAGLDIAGAVRLGARCGAANMTGRGPYAGQLDLRP